MADMRFGFCTERTRAWGQKEKRQCIYVFGVVKKNRKGPALGDRKKKRSGNVCSELKRKPETTQARAKVRGEKRSANVSLELKRKPETTQARAKSARRKTQCKCVFGAEKENRDHSGPRQKCAAKNAVRMCVWS